MKRVYAKEEVCIGCRLCEIYCIFQHSGHHTLVKAFLDQENLPEPAVRVEEDGARDPGLVPADEQPQIERDDYLFNALLNWRNLPQNIDSLNARCGIVSRSGFRLSPAARKMIEVLVSVDQQQVAIAL